MRSRLPALALAGTLGLTGLAGAAVLTPAVSYAAAGDSAEARPDSGHRGGHQGGHHDGPRGGIGRTAAAEALGMTEAELRAAGQEGKTLADLAQEKGVAEDVLVDALVTAARERLAQAVTDGRLTQEQADQRAEGLEERITATLDEVCRPDGPGHHGPRGMRGGQGGAPAPEAAVAPSSAT